MSDIHQAPEIEGISLPQSATRITEWPFTPPALHIAYLHYLYGEDTARHHVEQFADAARVLGHQVDVYAMNLAAPLSQADADPRPRSRVRRFLKRHLSRFLHEPKELLWNAHYTARESRLLRAARPEVLLVRDHTLTASCVPVARRMELPLVLEVNAPAVEASLYLAEQYLHLPGVSGWLEGLKLRAAAGVVAVSSALKRHLVERHRVDADKITVVPNGADVEAFRPGTPPDPGLPGAFAVGPVVGFVGSFQKWHGPALLGRMAAEVGRVRPAVRFVFVGDGPHIEPVRSGASELGDRAHFTGRVPHHRVPGLVAAFDVAVMPETAFYCSPLKVLEWMAAGKAVVAPGYPAVRELIDDDIHGLLFQPGDADELVAAVVRLVDQPDLRRSLGEAAAARVRASLTWRHNAARVLAVCQTVAARHRRLPAAAACSPLDDPGGG